MELMQLLIFGLGLALCTYGSAALFATWVSPRLLSLPLFSARMLVGRAEPTRTNRTVMAAWIATIGAYWAASVAEVRPLSTVLLIGAFGLTGGVLVVQRGTRR